MSDDITITADHILRWRRPRPLPISIKASKQLATELHSIVAAVRSLYVEHDGADLAEAMLSVSTRVILSPEARRIGERLADLGDDGGLFLRWLEVLRSITCGIPTKRDIKRAKEWIEFGREMRKSDLWQAIKDYGKRTREEAGLDPVDFPDELPQLDEAGVILLDMHAEEVFRGEAEISPDRQAAVRLFAGKAGELEYFDALMAPRARRHWSPPLTPFARTAPRPCCRS